MNSLSSRHRLPLLVSLLLLLFAALASSGCDREATGPTGPAISESAQTVLERPATVTPDLDPQVRAAHEQIVGMFEDVFSGDPDVASAALSDLYQLDPQIFPSILGEMIPFAPPGAQITLQQIINDYWNGLSRDALQSEGFDWCWVIKVKGTITVSGTVTVLGEPFDIGNHQIPIDSSFGDCPDCPLKARTKAPVKLDDIPVSFPIPMPPQVSWATGNVQVDLEFDVDLTITVEHHQCDPPKVKDVGEVEIR